MRRDISGCDNMRFPCGSFVTPLALNALRASRVRRAASIVDSSRGITQAISPTPEQARDTQQRSTRIAAPIKDDGEDILTRGRVHRIETGADAEGQIEDETGNPDQEEETGEERHPPNAIMLAEEGTIVVTTGVLQAARVKASHPYAQFASDVSRDTKCELAKQQRHGIGDTIPSPSGQQADISCQKMETTPSVSIGRDPQGVHREPTTIGTCAQAAAMSPTELRSVVERRAVKASTPYIADKWEAALRRAGLWNKYGHIPDGLRTGFDIGLPTILTTQTPPNKPSLTEHIQHFSIILERQINAGRYLGPASTLR